MERLLEIVVDFGEYFSGSITGAACPVIDQAFIDDYCKHQAISVTELKNAIRQYCFVYNYVNGCYTSELEDACRCPVSFELAAVAIQIYAATKRERDEEITEKNYRNRLAEVLDCDIQIIQKWFENYQDDVWKVYYDYCSVYDEYIDYDYRSIQCKPKTGSGRYVQYPLKYAERIFSTEDLKYIAGCFTYKKLYPGDVSSITDFKRIISESNIRTYSHTNHGKTVLGLASDAYRQVFSFYLRWNGEYKDYSGRDKQLKEQFKLYLKRSNGRYWLELRDTNSLNLQESIEFKLITYDKLKIKNYQPKRNNIILFQPYEDGYWEEVRYIEDKGQAGLLLTFSRQTIHGEIVLRTPYVTLYKITYNFNNKEYYSEQVLPYRFVGGLKVNYMTYLQGKGGAPILRLTNYIPVKIDGKKIEKVVDKDIFLDELPAGRHTINIRGFRDIQITFKESNPFARVWMNECNRWHIDKYNRWESQDPRDCEESSKGIVGLDFSAIPQKSQASNEPILTRWSKMLATNQYSLNESNITLKILKNTNYDR